MKYYISEDTGSVYWLIGDVWNPQTLMFAPISSNGSFDTEEGSAVELDLMGDEQILPDDNQVPQFKTFNELYAHVKLVLG